MTHRAGYGKNRRWWINCNMFKRLPLGLIDYHSKHDFDGKSSSAQFEGTCCHHRRTREANIFYVPAMASGTDSTSNF